MQAKPGEVLSENFVSVEETGARRISRGSLVVIQTADSSTGASAERAGEFVLASVSNPRAKDFLAPVKVLSANTAITRFALGEPYADAGAEGAVWTGALAPADGRSAPSC